MGNASGPPRAAVHRFDFPRVHVVVASLPIVGAAVFLSLDASGAPDLVWLTAALSGALAGAAVGWRLRHGAATWPDALLDAATALVVIVAGLAAAFAVQAPTRPLTERVGAIIVAWAVAAVAGAAAGMLWGALMRPLVTPPRSAARSRATAVGTGLVIALAMLLPAAITGGTLATSASGTAHGMGLRSILSAVVLGPALSPSAAADVGLLATAHASTVVLAVALVSALLAATTVDRVRRARSAEA